MTLPLQHMRTWGGRWHTQNSLEACKMQQEPASPKNFCLGQDINDEFGMTVVIASAVNFKKVLGFWASRNCWWLKRYVCFSERHCGAEAIWSHAFLITELAINLGFHVSACCLDSDFPSWKAWRTRALVTWCALVAVGSPRYALLPEGAGKHLFPRVSLLRGVGRVRCGGPSGAMNPSIYFRGVLDCFQGGF